MGLARRIADYAKGIFTDSSGNVGVGTTSPNKGGVSRAVTLNTASGGNIIEMCVAEDRKGWVYVDDARTVLSAGGNRLAEIQTNGVARIAVDGSGRVTTPAQPAFHAFPNTSLDTSTSGAVIPFNSTVLNIGGSYNTSTCRFTAPVAGTYFFTASFWAPGGTVAYAALARNGDVAALGARGRIIGSSNYVFLTLTSTIYLAQNDYVDVRHVDGTIHINNGFNNFSGYLIG